MQKALAFLVILGAGVFTACSPSPEKMITKRWKLADLQGRNKAAFERANKRHLREIEFGKDKKMTMYEDGDFEQQLDYALSSDGKSILLPSPGEPESASIRILKLNGDEMHLTAGMFGEDTVILRE